MNFKISVLFALFAAVHMFAADDVLKFHAKLGFVKGEDKIASYEFIDDEKKLVIVGQKSIQVWDVDNAKLLNSVTHQIEQFAPSGWFGSFVLLGLPKALKWRPWVIEPWGKWIMTSEKIGEGKIRSAVIRDLTTLETVKTLDLPNVDIDYVALDETRNEILVFGFTGKMAGFGSFDRDSFERKDTYTVDDFKYQQTIRNATKVIVGSGQTKTDWVGPNQKQGGMLTLRNVRDGKIEREYTAEGFQPKSFYEETEVSEDEKYLVSKREDRVLVWDIEGDGRPKYEIKSQDPKKGLSIKQIVDRRFIVVKIDDRIVVYDIAGNGSPKFEVARKFPNEDIDYKGLIVGEYLLIQSKERLRVYRPGASDPMVEFASEKPGDTVYLADNSPEKKMVVVRDDDKAMVYDLEKPAKPLYEIVRENKNERFYMTAFIEPKGVLAVARVNNAEQHEPRTEFYDMKTGQRTLTIPLVVDGTMGYANNDSLIVMVQLGSFNVWNRETGRVTRIPLKFHSAQSNSDRQAWEPEDTSYNTEFAQLSRDFKYIMRWGGKVTFLFDASTGNSVQSLYDAAYAKFDKKTKLVENSGLGTCGWTKNGKYALGLDDSGFFDTARGINFWKFEK